MTTSTEEYEMADPNPAATIHAFRAFGYDVTSAIADLIDNSISAEAKRIEVYFHWDGEASYAYVLDNGRGMAEERVKEAMRPGTSHPDHQRDAADLGRFGLGLKTASFSQCKILTISSTDSSAAPVQKNWNLDYVNEHNAWRLLKGPGTVAQKVLAKLGTKHPRPGTVVVWESMDRLIAEQEVSDKDAHRRFLNTLDRIAKHLSMVFHQFLSGPSRIKILLNDEPIEAWDPFLSGEPATQEPASEIHFLRDHKIKVTPYILPHHSKITDKQYDLAQGPRGWADMQGFFVYRNKRLLVAGDWLGLGFRKEEHYKLARIKIELPNALDHEWQLDVKKCTAIPHPQVQSSLKRIALATRSRASEIYRHRGKVLARKSGARHIFVWQEKIRKSKRFFSINREHPMVMHAFEKKDRASINALLRLVEETIPAEYIQQLQNETPDSMSPPFETSSSPDLIRMLEELYECLRKAGKSHKDSISQLTFTEPFDKYPELIPSLEARLKKKG